MGRNIEIQDLVDPTEKGMRWRLDKWSTYKLSS